MAHQDIFLVMLTYGVFAALIWVGTAYASKFVAAKVRSERLKMFLLRERSFEAAVVSVLVIWAVIFFAGYYWLR